MDGVDAAIASFSDTRFEILQSHFTPYPEDLKAVLTAIIHPDWQGGLKTLLDVDYEIGKVFAETANSILATHENPITAIGTHGQTIRHQPTSTNPNSWQLGDPNLIVEATGITTVSDWRRRDMATGGQGAPLTPAFNARFFRRDHNVAILNLGGIANISIVPADEDFSVLGFDTGPANTLIDSWSARHQGNSFDHEGAWAATGKINQQLLSSMLRDSYFSLAPPKSTGREYFNHRFLEHHLARLTKPISHEDVQATLTELTAQSIVDAIQNESSVDIKEVLICGGGAYNQYLVSRLKSIGEKMEWVSTVEYGVRPENMEAVAFAWFAKLTVEQKPLELASITGGKQSRIAGAVYFGANGYPTI